MRESKFSNNSFFKKFHKDNSGATLVVVLIVVAFIAVLGSVAIAGAMVNLKMKVVDKKAKKTFYSCEEAVDEIYSELGMVSMDALEAAYKDVMDTMVRSQKNDVPGSDDPSWTNYSVSRDPSSFPGLSNADVELRKKYMAKVVNDLTDGSFNETSPMPLDSNKFRKLINSYIGVDITIDAVNSAITAGTYRHPYVASVGTCSYTIDYSSTSLYIFNADDVKVEYITDDGYKSELTYDIGIMLPISDINFSSSAQSINNVPAMGSFSLIADNGIIIDNNKQVLIDGNVYAGGGGIVFGDSSRTRFIGEQVITNSDVTTEKQTQITFSGSTQLWCNNIIIPKNYRVGGYEQPCHGVELNLEGQTFVKNDLKINGASSKVSIGGQYSGYSNSGISDLNKDESSAIIVNGAHSNLTLRTSYIYLAGRSYIVYDGTTEEPYRTGESLSFKGDQEAYLVPPTVVNNAAGAVVGNPCSDISRVNGTTLAAYLKNEYFAKSLLDDSMPYVTKAVNGQYFIYLNFKDAKAASDYMYLILSSDTDFETKLTGLGISGTDADKATAQKNYMQNLIKVNLKDLDQQTTGFVNASGSVTTSGVIVSAEVTGSDASVGAAVSMAPLSDDAQQLVTNDLKNRFKSLTTVLDMSSYSTNATDFAGGIPIPFTGQSGRTVNYNTVLGYGSSVGERVVSRPDIVTASQATAGEGVSSLGGNIRKYGNNEYAIVIANGGYTYTASSGFKGGIIVSIGNVNINADFDGLVIALATDASNGNINIKSDVNVMNTISAASLIESICEQVSDENADKLIKVFRGTRTGGGSGGSGGSINDKISIESIKYNQLVYFNNWKKTDVD